MVHFKSNVQFSKNISFGRDTTIRPYSFIITNGGNIKIGKECTLGQFSMIATKTKDITIGDFVRIGPHVNIVGSNYEFKKKGIPIFKQGITEKGITIGDDVWIGTGSTILDGVNIAEGVVVAAGAVINKDFPPYSIVGGVPARIIGMRE
jgi:acetyltransferase-like isoleucine patch superfamily enzyme